MQHILVCDDERDIVAALKTYLESDGYCVHTAYSGEEALRVAKTEPVQLALMDIMMPGMDGITAMAKLREFSNIPGDFTHGKIRGFRQDSGPQRGRGRLYHKAL